MTGSGQPLIELRKATKDFRGNYAVRDVDLHLFAGEVHALLGENGAGKSTLMKLVAGIYPPSSGELFLKGRPTQLRSPTEALENGIAMVFQETNLVPSMTVAQNIFLGSERLFNRARGVNIRAQQHLQGLGFHVEPTALVSTLGAAKKQMVEIARAVHHRADVFIFDEPTATLTPEEKYHFFALVEKLRLRGAAIVFITHALEEALAISQRITVLRDGALVRTGPARDFTRDSIIRDMVGRDLAARSHGGGHSRTARPLGDCVLTLQNLTMDKVVRGATLSAYAGQVTGLFGLVGAGRTEMMKIVAGVMKRDLFHGGRVLIDGKSVRFRVPAQAVAAGIAYVSEDRKLDGMFDTLEIGENILLGKLAKSGLPLSIVRPSQLRHIARDWAARLGVRAVSASAKVVELSGGNQQKIVIAKSLIQTPRIVIFDEPTRGVDVGAISEIHAIINDMADAGLTVIVISSYLPEILALSDRILVARQGRIVEELAVEEATEERIMFAAVH
jgi:ABC-type sugar transport system ATPase subunit